MRGYIKSLFKVIAVLIVLLQPNAAKSVDDSVNNPAAPNGLALIRAANWEAAFHAINANSDPLLFKYAYWRYLRDDSTAVPFEKLNQFMIDNPAWPGIRIIQGKAEYQLPYEWTAEQILEWFNRNPPVGFEGKRRLAEAYLQTGKENLAKPILQDYWRNAFMDYPIQSRFYEKYRKYLTQSDNMWRLNSLIESHNFAAARQYAKYLGRGFPALADAQIAYFDKSKRAAKLYAKVPKSLRNSPGLILGIIRQKRDANKNSEAMDYLIQQPAFLNGTEPEWWDERRIIVQRLIKAKSFKAAYKTAAQHGLKDGIPLIEAEFISGWLALQKLNNTSAAYKHFKTVYEKSNSPISLARGCYWLARVYEKTKDANYAKTWYTHAIKFPSTFYGQLARQNLGHEAASFELPSMPPITSQMDQDFQNNELVKMAKFLSAQGEQSAVDIFIQQLSSNAVNLADLAQVVNLTNEIGRRDLAVAIARQSRMKGFDLIRTGFPIMSLAGNPNQPEDALVHAIIRQESSFNTTARSTAGALGLMQLMPGVAKNLSRQLGIAYKESWLTERPEFNVTLGKLLLEKKIGMFDQNYPMAIASYNAGPSRVNEWIEDYGDPRTGKIDMVDWIEMIPYGETRNYVHRVLENLVIYRYLLQSQTQS